MLLQLPNKVIYLLRILKLTDTLLLMLKWWVGVFKRILVGFFFYSVCVGACITLIIIFLKMLIFLNIVLLCSCPWRLISLLILIW